MRQHRLRAKIITLRQAAAFIRAHHRHHRPPQGHKISIGIRTLDDPELVGVVVVGRPIAASYDDGETLEVTRSCTDGTPNANSALYGAAWRAAKALGADRLITYTQFGESGASLRAAGFRVVAVRPAQGGWNSPGRPRVDTHPIDVPRTLWLIGTDLPTTGQRRNGGDPCQPAIEPGRGSARAGRPPATHSGLGSPRVDR